MKALIRFQDSEELFKLTKLLSKRPNSMVDVNQSQTGYFELIELFIEPYDGEQVSVMISRGFEFLRTSRVLKILEEGENFTKFETLGGVYLLEMLKNEHSE